MDAKKEILCEPLSLKVFIIDKEDDDVSLFLHFRTRRTLPMTEDRRSRATRNSI